MQTRERGYVVTLIAAIITIVIFFTGYEFFPDLLKSLWNLRQTPETTVTPPGTLPGSRLVQIRGEVWSIDFTEAHIYEVHPLSEQQITDFVVGADVQIKDSSPEFHGIMFRHQDNENFYSFRISQDGKYAFDVWQSGDDDFYSLLGPAHSDAILPGPGKTNRLKVVGQGNRFELYVNDIEVGSVTSDTFAKGRVGLVSCTCGGSSSASARFLNGYVDINP